jgi:hypothetical protein
MAEPVKEVVFGGVIVPANTKREVINQDGKKMYCVWLNSDGAKITYPEHQQLPSATTRYTKTDNYPTGNASEYKPRHIDITEGEFNNVYQKAEWGWKDYKKETTDLLNNDKITTVNVHRKTLGGRDVVAYTYNKVFDSHCDEQPRIDVKIGGNLDYYDICNIENATLKGSPKSEKITLYNTSNSTIDVNDGNLDAVCSYHNSKNNTVISDSEDIL